jgi:hypothetical protein
MKSIIGIFALAAVVVLVQGYARTDELNGSTHQGVVERIFVEQDLGVYVDRETSPGNQAGTAWVDVKFLEPLADGSTTAIALLPPYLRVKPGDRVEMRFAGGDGGHNDAALDQNRVTALLQKDGTPLGPVAHKHLAPSEHQSRPVIGL